jgi:hypothetical protein
MQNPKIIGCVRWLLNMTLNWMFSGISVSYNRIHPEDTTFIRYIMLPGGKRIQACFIHDDRYIEHDTWTGVRTK